MELPVLFADVDTSSDDPLVEHLSTSNVPATRADFFHQLAKAERAFDRWEPGSSIVTLVSVCSQTRKTADRLPEDDCAELKPLFMSLVNRIMVAFKLEAQNA